MFLLHTPDLHPICIRQVGFSLEKLGRAHVETNKLSGSSLLIEKELPHDSFGFRQTRGHSGIATRPTPDLKAGRSNRPGRTMLASKEPQSWCSLGASASQKSGAFPPDAASRRRAAATGVRRQGRGAVPHSLGATSM